MFEQLDLASDVDHRLAEGSHALKTEGKKNPLNLCLAADATRGMAGVLRARLGTTASLCKFFAAATTGGQAGFCMRDLAVFDDGNAIFIWFRF